MNRAQLQAYIEQVYGVAGEYIFAKYPAFQVFRHGEGRKWFAVIFLLDMSYDLTKGGRR